MSRMPGFTALGVLVAALAVTPVGALRQDPATQQPTFRSVVDSVAVDVSVRNGTSVVSTLSASDFHVLDNGIRQEVTTASFGTLPIDVTVVLDVSYSEEGAPLARLEKGVLELASGLGRDDRLRLLAFNEDVRRVMNFTGDQTEIATAVKALSARGLTSIFDALATAMVAPTDPSRRQLVVTFTDAEDTSSITEPRQLLEAGRRSQATVTVVMPRSVMPRLRVAGRVGANPPIELQDGPGPLVSEDVHLLTELTDLTGGHVIADPGPPSDLGQAFRLALDTLRSSYVLFFSPRDVTRAGFHTLTVSIPDHPKYTVRARSGYFGS